MSHLSEYPARLRASTVHPETIYIRAAGCHAVKGASPACRSGAAKGKVITIEDEGNIYQIFEGEPKTPTEEVTAVYRGDGNLLCVPTGRIFIRLEEGLRAEDFADAFRKLGFVIAQSLPYAPHAAWLEREDGDAAAALRSVSALEQLPQVRNVEPQLLTARTWR
ncbi:MAG: hypothetical protein NZM18_10010 [Thermoflexales bacterium]|nr:hypothetical protein [Thermoflexales bacterium]MDW8351265.1 hypothetical protein [Anaerolineae bacterium]